jgi:hypothetical protein
MSRPWWRSADMERASRLLDGPIGHGSPLMLAKVLDP